MILSALVLIALFGAVTVALLGLSQTVSPEMSLPHRVEKLHVDGDFLKNADGRVVGRVLR